MNYSRSHIPKSELYVLKEEFLEIVECLWDSYEDDAFIRDKQSGVFLDSKKMHRLDYRSKYFSVNGPLNISPSIQGRPVIFQAGTSEEFMNIASKHADGVLVRGDHLEYAQQFSKELKRRVSQEGRSPDDLLIMPVHDPIIGKTEAEAKQKFQELQALSPYLISKPDFSGSAEQVADKVQLWYESGAMDLLTPAGLSDWFG